METPTTVVLFDNTSMKNNVKQGSSSFMEEVETYMMYVVASFIDMYWFPVLIPIGLVGNTLSFFVMIKPKIKKVSTCIYMAAINVNDNLMMFPAFHYWLVSAANIHKWHLWECQLSAYLHIFVYSVPHIKFFL